MIFKIIIIKIQLKLKVEQSYSKTQLIQKLI
jgi:hypothetical protein